MVWILHDVPLFLDLMLMLILNEAVSLAETQNKSGLVLFLSIKISQAKTFLYLNLY